MTTVVALTVFFTCSPLRANADPVSFSFGGLITEVDNPSGFDLGYDFAVGQQFDGGFTYDENAAPSFLDPNTHFIAFPPNVPPVEMHVTVGSFVRRLDALGFQTDTGYVFPASVAASPLFFFSTGSSFGAFAVPSADTLLQSFNPQSTRFSLEWDAEDETPLAAVKGHPTFLRQVAPVPEPSTLVLLASGISAIAARTLRRRYQSDSITVS